MPPDPTPGLLFAIFSIHLNSITRDQLAAATAEWIRDPSRLLADILVEHGALDRQTRGIVEDVVARHLDQHGGDTGQSFADVRETEMITPQLGPAFDATMTFDATPENEVGRHRADFNTDSPEPHSLPGPATGGTRYRVERPHDRGGMGEVFVARDTDLRRQVLLKQLPEHRADDPRHRTAFLKEVRAAAALEHPSIAPVYDVGHYPDGRLFHVMRLIPGGHYQLAIRSYHDSRGTSSPADRVLRFRELLGHFIDACQAIEYAHSRGVLHRDLKPNNIMLGSFGETQVIDWGLARVSGQDLSSGSGSGLKPLTPDLVAEGSEPTLDGQFKGTLAYASPEQAKGEADRIDARSDVYALGATLYCLLTGQAPFQSHSSIQVDDVQQGRFLRPRRVHADVPPALESICLKALAYAREDRYQSARALAIDVERWLADEPVLAHPDPVLVRLRRWGRKHRTTVAAAAALLLASVVGLTIGFAAVKVERDLRVESGRIGLAAIDELLVEIADDYWSNIPESEPSRIKMLRAAVSKYQQLLQVHPDDTDIELGLAMTQMRLANLLRMTAQHDESTPLFEESTAALEQLVVRHPGTLRYLKPLILARQYHGSSIAHTGGPVAAERFQRATLALATQCREADPASVTDEARAGWELADTLRILGDIDEASRLVERAVEVYPSIADGVEGTLQDKLFAAMALADAARLAVQTGDATKAAIRSTEAIRRIDQLLRTDPGGNDYLHQRSFAQHQLALATAASSGRTDEALSLLDRAIATMDTIIGGKSEVVEYRTLLLEMLVDRSEMLALLRREAEAEEQANQAVSLGERLSLQITGSHQHHSTTARAFATRAEIRVRTGNHVGAGTDVIAAEALCETIRVTNGQAPFLKDLERRISATRARLDTSETAN